MLRGNRRALGALVAGLALIAAACGGGTSRGGHDNVALTPPNIVTNDAVRDGGSVTVALDTDVPNLNPLSGDASGLAPAEVMNGILPAAFTQLPDFTVRMNSDLLASADVTAASPQTVVYKIQPNAVWSDGKPIEADDFVYNWQTQSGSDAKYNAAGSTGYEDIKSVTGSDGGKTVTVVFSKPFGDWKSLFGVLMPAHVMRVAADPAKLFNDGPAEFAKVSGGPFVLDSFDPNKQIVLKRNDRYYGPRAHLDSVIFRIVPDANNEPQALANNEVQVVNPTPQIDLVNNVNRIGGAVKTEIGQGPNFEHFDFNLANPAVAKLPLRQAIFTAVDRQQILNATVKQFSGDIGVLNNRMLIQGQAGYQDNVTATGLGSGNTAAAKKILTDAGYRIEPNRLIDPSGKPVPTLVAKYRVGSPVRQQELESLKAQVAPLGVQIDIQTTDDLGTIFGSGDFDIVVFTWIGSPFPSSSNKSIYTTDGGQNIGKYSDPVVDSSLTAAAGELDPGRAAVQLNAADQQLSRDAYTLPLYQNPTFLAYYGTYGNVRNNATSVGMTWNIGQWGLRN